MQNDRAKYMTNPKHEILNAKQIPMSKFKMVKVLSIGISCIRFLREGKDSFTPRTEGPGTRFRVKHGMTIWPVIVWSLGFQEDVKNSKS